MPFRSLFAALLLWPVGPASADVPKHRVNRDLTVRARSILLTYCGSCHGDIKDPRGRLRVADHAALTDARPPVPFVSVERSQVVELVEDGSMPPGPLPRPAKEEAEVLREWAKAGAPAYPKRFDEEVTADAVIGNLRSLSDADQKNARYVSFAHLLQDGASPVQAGDQLKQVADAEVRLRAALGDGPDAPKPERLRSVDPAATVFRLDLRDHGWQHRELFKYDDGGGAIKMIPFDLIWLEYPYSVPPSKLGRGEVAQAVQRMNAHRGEGVRPEDVKMWGLFRPALYLRGDWLADALRAKDGKPTPLADDLAALAKLGDVPEDKRHTISGPKPRPFAADGPLKADHPPIGSWAVRNVTAPTEPLTLTVATKLPQPLKPKVGDKLELTATSDRKAKLSVLYVGPGGEPTLLVLVTGADLKANAATRVSPNEEGVIALNADGRVYYVLVAAETAVKVSVVASVHGKNNVWRFFPDDPDAAAVRKVIPIDVTK